MENKLDSKPETESVQLNISLPEKIHAILKTRAFSQGRKFQEFIINILTQLAEKIEEGGE